ncbi:Protein kinase domain [Carpediemonas membranifera]|uniref:non-specific serine/threonine protein kinase n=1 Tax=Carpediemonas membranifera TaxID=201153 RepID=A0A8J6AX61_9EUKA|nr:Protein kinase domain [Carpediemonas membranifera]|eukprot:KAG9394715.1 Protein kinase domain [Carpediemonas membranifera]
MGETTPVYRTRTSKAKRKEEPSNLTILPDLCLENFELIRLLGKGDVGRVYIARHKPTGRIVSLKIFNREEMVRRNKLQRIYTEREILATAKHPFIVTCHGSFSDADNIYVTMDFCQGGEFFYYLHSKMNDLKEDQIRTIVCEIILAIEYLHSLGVIYRDLKPENILIHESGHIRIADFDLSKRSTTCARSPVKVSDSTKMSLKFSWRDRSLFSSHDYVVGTNLDLVAQSFVGTEEYLAPEVITGPDYTMAVDWWTLGVLTYEMFYGFTPFRGSTANVTFANIVRRPATFPSKPKVKMSANAKAFIQALLEPDANHRLGAVFGASEVKQHKWFKGFQWSLIPKDPPIHLSLHEDVDGVPDLSYFPRLSELDSDAEDDDEVEVLGQASVPVPPQSAQGLD